MFARDAITRRDTGWLRRGKVIELPSPLRAGYPASGMGEQKWVRVVASDADCFSLALVELAATHVNGARPSMGALLRLVISRGAELARYRRQGITIAV